MRRLLHLQHPAHTGKILPHHHTSYRSLFIVMVFFSIALAGIHHSVRANDTLLVLAKVSAAIPTTGAVITAPVDQSETSDKTVDVSGTCQYLPPATIISLYSNTAFVGSTVCSPDSTFTLSITLQIGENQLLAKTSNSTDDYGPDSNSVRVTYTPQTPPTPVPPTQPNSPDRLPDPSSSAPTPIPNASFNLSLRSKYTYLLFGPGKAAEWAGSIEGGTAPYSLTIDWGDGTSTRRDNLPGEDISITHAYTKWTTYFVLVTARDASGAVFEQRIAAVTPYSDPTFSGKPTDTLYERLLISAIWGNVAALAVITGIIWYDATYHRKNVPKKRP